MIPPPDRKNYNYPYELDLWPIDLEMVLDTLSPYGLYLCHIMVQKGITAKILEYIGQGVRSLCAKHTLMLMVIYAKLGSNSSRTVCAVERTRKDVPYFNSLIAKPWPNDLEGIGQGQRSLCMAHPLILVIMCAYYRKNPFRTVCAVEWTRQDVPYFSSLLQSRGWMTLKI